MIKSLLILFFTISLNFLFSQNRQLDDILKDVKRDSTDKTCQLLFDDFYDSFESDEGLNNPKIMLATINFYQYQADSTLTNRQLVLLLKKYMDALSDPKIALFWIQALKKEYIKVYGKVHPLLLLYQGESLIDSGNNAKAYKHFIGFQKDCPNSVMAMVYVYKTEENSALAKTWLSVLKTTHPNHWAVQKL